MIIPSIAKLNVIRVQVLRCVLRIKLARKSLKNIFIENTRKDQVISRNPIEDA